MIAGFSMWFYGGWAFVAVYGAIVGICAADAARERRIALGRAQVGGPPELDRYELAMLDEDVEVAAVRLAVVNLLHRGVLEPGTKWGPRPEFGAPLFALVINRELPGDAHPIEVAIVDAARTTPPKSAEGLFKQLANCDVVAGMRAGLVEAGLLYRKRRASPGWQIAASMLPWIAFFAWPLTFPAGGVTPTIPELIVNMPAVSLAPLLVLAVTIRDGPTAFGAAVNAEQHDLPARDVEPHNNDAVQELLHACETRFVGL